MSYLPLIIAFVLLFIGVPVAYAMLIPVLIYFTFINNAMPADLVLQQFVSGVQSFPLLAIPFFTMAAVVMNYSGITRRLMDFADLLVGHMRGGLAQVNVVLSALNGGISGSSNADAAMDCKMLVPEMQKRGFSKGFSAAVTVASSCIAPVIPPGIMMILYCIVCRVSIGKMFLAGYAPGLIMTVILMITVSVMSKKRGYGKTREKMATPKEIVKGAWAAILALAMPLGIIMGMRIGLFTATEAGAIGVLYCLIIGIFVYKELKWSDIPKILLETLYSNGQVMFIIVGANLLGMYMTYERIPHQLSEFLMGLTTNPTVYLLLVNVFLLIVGMFLDGSPAILILGPLLAPPAIAMGIDPVHFGIICVVNLVIGGATPPFASMMFICCSMLDMPAIDYMKEIWPFLIALLIALAITTFFPSIVMFLPNLVMG